MKTMSHPRGLYLLSFTEMAERFSYYGMRAILTLYLASVFFTESDTSLLYGSFIGLIYLTPLVGGYIADKFWGNRRSIIVGGITMVIGQFLLFVSACIVKQSIFEKNGLISAYVDNSLPLVLMIMGLIALILGNGFFKPCISTMVGDLYDNNDTKSSKAFNIFYMGINIGALVSPILCGILSKKGDWANPGAFKWGFFCAGVAMIISLIVFCIGKNKYLVSPEGKPIGMAPKKIIKAKDNITEEKRSKNSPVRLCVCILGGVILTILFSLNAQNYNDYISAIIYAACIVLPVLIITDKGLTKQEKKKIGVIYIIAAVSIVFWALYEQAGSSLTFIADSQCDRLIGNFEFKTAWLQSINPLAVILVTIPLTKLWEYLQKRNREPSIPAKTGIGLIIMSLGYLFIAYGSDGVSETNKLSMWWIWGLYIIHAISEMCLSPVGLDMVTKLSPARFTSLIMGVWFMSSAVSGILSGKLATYHPTAEEPIHYFLGMEISSLTSFFMIFAMLGAIAGIILLALSPRLTKMMGGSECQVVK